MQELAIDITASDTFRVLCLGAHCDDIEIGCGGTLLKILQDRPDAEIDWIIFCADDSRDKESQKAANMFAGDRCNIRIHPMNLRDGFLPYDGAAAKDALRALSAEIQADIIFTHHGEDAHQDHRLVSEITWNIFRDHLILEYEIPKYDGDLASPNIYVPLTNEIVDQKVRVIIDSFRSQAEKHWFSEDTFRSILRLRGIESSRGNVYAEAFYCRKMLLSPISES